MFPLTAGITCVLALKHDTTLHSAWQGIFATGEWAWIGVLLTKRVVSLAFQEYDQK